MPLTFTRTSSARTRSECAGIEQTGEITVVGRAGNPTGGFLTTTDSAGNFADRGFHLVVISYEGFAS